MQSTRKIIVSFTLLLLFVLTACSNAEHIGTEVHESAMPQSSIVEIDKELFPNSSVETIQIYKNMTLKEIIAMIGEPDADVGGVRHPFFLVWNMQDGRELNITFYGSDYKDFKQRLYNDEFVLPGEDAGAEQIISWQSLTPNEQKVVKEWCLNTQARQAYVREIGKENIVLFE